MSTRAVSALSALIRSLKKALGRAEKAKEKVVEVQKTKAKKPKKARKSPEQIAVYQAALREHADQVAKLTRITDSVEKELKAAEQTRKKVQTRAEAALAEAEQARSERERRKRVYDPKELLNERGR